MLAGWHPALWWIDRRLHVEREIACDETTVAITGSAKSYAQCLMTLASRTGAPRVMRMAPAALRSSDLHARVVKILSPYPSIAPVWSRGIAGGMIAGLCVTSVGVGGVKLVEAAGIALPFVSPTFTATPNGPTAAAVVTAPSRAATPRPARRQAGTPSSPQPATERRVPSAPDTVPSVSTAAIDVQPGMATELPGTAHAVAGQVEVTRDPSPPSAAAQPQSPWNAVASGGVVIGRKSKDAGVATAGFFSRFARRVAGSF
jgi:hypothetical protein